MTATRRDVLAGGALIGGIALVGLAQARAGGAGTNPFTLGVASGDPAPDGMVLCCAITAGKSCWRAGRSSRTMCAST